MCFIDDQMHDKMKNKNVLYVNIFPYIYNLNYNEICKYLQKI